MNNLFPSNKNKQQLERILTGIARELDLPDGMFEKVEKRYKNVSSYIERPDSILSRMKPHIYVHGSFSLGTMIKPSNDCSEFDIDCICELELSPSKVCQKDVKEMVGCEINKYIKTQSFNKELKEWDKCWTMEYSDSDYVFKMDFVPAIPDVNALFTPNSRTSIYITDKTHPYYNIIHSRWERGNPKAYAEWFKNQMIVRLKAIKRSMAINYSAQGYTMDAEEIPDYKVKTPLQMSVQLLKRHRDIFFKNNENRPSSIILTTLAAKAYKNDESLVDSMDKIIKGIRSHIEVRNGVYWISNPVDSFENLAESWSDCRICNEFFRWLEKLEYDWASTYNDNAIITNDLFAKQYGQRVSDRILVNMGIASQGSSCLTINYNVPHREKPLWPIYTTYYVHIKGMFSTNGDIGTWQEFKSGTPLTKLLKLRFFAATNASLPYTVYWQVVNTGEEARAAYCLRGGFYPSKTIGSGGLNSCTAMRDEHTEYKGVHWVQCFIVNNNGLCIAKSDPFIVNIQ